MDFDVYYRETKLYGHALNLCKQISYQSAILDQIIAQEVHGTLSLCQLWKDNVLACLNNGSRYEKNENKMATDYPTWI